MGRSGHNQDKPAFTLFSFASGLFVQPINFHYKDQMQRSLVLDCFLQKKRSKRSRKTTPGSGTNKSKNKEELSKAFSKLQFDEVTVDKQFLQCLS